MNKLLIVDDDIHQLKYMESMLKDLFCVQTSNNVLQSMDIIKNNEFDAIIVDVHMPIINGFDFIKILQKDNLKPALFILSSDTSETTKLEALRLGVRDFLWPEMKKDEVALRIKNHIMNASKEFSTAKTYKDIKIDLSNFSVLLSDKKIELTLIEFKILYFLVERATTPVNRDDLKNFTWNGSIVLDKTINTHLTNLRSKLLSSEIEIKTIKGEGILLI